MWRTTSKPLFIFCLLSFLSASPSFSFAMQPEKTLSSEREKESKRERRRGKKIDRDGDGIGMIICEQVLMTSPLLTPLCLLSDQTACCHMWSLYHCKSSLQKEEESCILMNNRWRLAIVESATTAVRSDLVRVVFRLGGKDDMFQPKWDCIYLQSKMWSQFSSK